MELSEGRVETELDEEAFARSASGARSLSGP